MRKRISARYVGLPIVNWGCCLLALAMGWPVWILAGVDTLLGALVFASFLALLGFGLYLGSHVRRVEFDESNLYVGRLFWRGFIQIPLAQIKSYEPQGFLFGHEVLISFDKKTEAGRWILLKPRLPFWPRTTNPADVMELIALIDLAAGIEPK